VTIVDEFRPDGLRTMDLTDLDIAVMTQPQGLPMDVRISGKVPSGTDVSSLALVGTVARAAASAAPGDIQAPAVQFQGTLDVLRVDLRQMMDFFGPRPIPDQVHGMANLKSRISLVPGVSGYDMVLSDMKADIERLAIAGQASLSGIMTRQPTFGLTVSATPVSLDELLSRFPTQWLPPHLQSVLAERDIKGIVEVVTATVTGSTTPTPRASVTGEFRVREGQALLGRDRTPARDLAGTVLLEPDRLRAADITGQYGRMEISTGKLAITFLEQGPSLELDVSGTMAAADLVAALARNIGSAAVAKPLGQLRNIQGQTGVIFRLAGFLNRPDGLAFTGAEITPRDVSFQSPSLPEPVTRLSGKLMYAPAALEFDRMEGALGPAQFQLHGAIATEGPAQFRGFSAWTRAPARQVLSLMSPGAAESPALQGPVGIALSLAGPVTAPQIKGIVELNEATLTAPGFLHKPAGQPAVLEFDAALSPDRTLDVPRLDFIMPPARLSGKSRIQFGPAARMSSSLISGPIPLNNLPPGMVLGGFDSGTLEISLDVKGRGSDWKTWALTGWVALTDGRLPGAGTSPVTDIYLRAKLVRGGADIKRLEFRVHDSFIRVAGTVRNWRRKPVITATVESPNLDLDLLIPRGERSPVRDMLEDFAAAGRLTASVAITLGRYKHLTINDLGGRMNIADEVLDISQITGQIGEGTLEGRLVARLPRRKPAEAEVRVQLASVPHDQFIRLFDDQQRIQTTGDLFLTATLQGNTRNPLGLANTLNGTVDYQVRNGRLIKGILIPRLLAILDIPNRLQGKLDLSGEGMPIDKFSSTVAIRNGIATTDNMLVDSPVVKIAMAGSYDIPTDQLNMEVVVSPFGSYTKLLQSIPLFGRLIAGERKGFTTAFFDVKGSLKEPQIINRPMKSVGAGVTGLAQLAFDVLKNTAMLPIEIFSSGDDKAPGTGAKPAPQPVPPPADTAPAPAGSP
jgi:hypothetical protein